MPRQELRHFGFDGLGEQLVCPVAQDLGERIPDFAGHPWILLWDSRIVGQVAYSLLAKGG